MTRLRDSRRQCRLCQTPFRGRTDKVFCSLACKNEYHLRLRQATARAVRHTDIILHRNRSILLEILGKNKQRKKVDRLTLDRKKFNFHYLTGYYANASNKIYNLIYDFAWMEYASGEILVMRRKKD